MMCLKQRANLWHLQLTYILWKDDEFFLEDLIFLPTLNFEGPFLVPLRFLQACQEEQLTLWMEVLTRPDILLQTHGLPHCNNSKKCASSLF